MKSRAEERTQKRSKAFIKEGKGLKKEIVCTLSVPAVSQLGSRGRTMYNLFRKLNYLPSSHSTVFHRHSSDCVNTLQSCSSLRSVRPRLLQEVQCMVSHARIYLAMIPELHLVCLRQISHTCATYPVKKIKIMKLSIRNN